MAQLKSTSVTGNLSVTGNTVASSFIKYDGLINQFLMADGHVENAQNFNQNFVLNNTDIAGVKQVTTQHLKLQSENFNDSAYDHIYVGNTNDLIKYRTVNQFRADLKLAQVYDYKDTLDTLDELKAITSAEVGDTYFIADLGESWSCKKKVTAATNDNYTTYWSNLGNTVDLSGYTTLNTNQTITGLKTFTNSIAFKNTKFSNNYDDTEINTIMSCQGSKTQHQILKLLNNPAARADAADSPFGNGLIFESSGSTYIGSGESGTAIYKTIRDGYKTKDAGGNVTDTSQCFKAAEDEKLYLCSDTNTYFYSNCQSGNTPKITTYDTSGNWTMPRSLILARGTNADVCIEFTRGTAVDWKLLSASGDFIIQCDYTTAEASKEYYDVIKLKYNTGDMYVKGNIVSSSADNTQSLGSSSKKWKRIYCYDLNDQITLSKTDNTVSMKTNTSLNAHYGLNWTNATWTSGGDDYDGSSSINLKQSANNDAVWNLWIDDDTTEGSDATWQVIPNTTPSTPLLQCIAEPSYEVNIPHGKLGLSNANFIYNSIDKCIDVTFT